MDQNKLLKEKVKMKIAISNMCDDMEETCNMNEPTNNNKINKNNKNKGQIYSLKNIGIAACLLVVFSGVVFAKDIETFIKDKFNLGSGIQTAINNGYIEEPKKDYKVIESKLFIDNKERLNTLDVGIKVDSFLIDKSNLSMDFNIKLYENDIALKNIDNVNLGNVIAMDDSKRILYSNMGKEKFDEYCKNNNLDFEYLDFNENYLNSGLNNFIEKYDENENNLNLIYNMYLENEEYPKAEKISIYFENIDIDLKDEQGKSIKYLLSGDYNLSLDVPSKMIDKEAIEYKVVKSDNKDFDIYCAKASETGFDLGVKIHNIEKPKYPKELDDAKKEMFEKYSKVNNDNLVNKSNNNIKAVTYVLEEDILNYYENSEYKTIYEDYYTKAYPVSNIREVYIRWLPKTKGNYILNSNGDKFYISQTLGGNGKNHFIDDNTFDSYSTFDMTKFDLTDRVTVVLYLYGNPYEIELERVK